jgi:hypothetical protein
MKTIIFVTVEAEPLARLEFVEGAVVADLLRHLEGRGTNIAELLVFIEDQDQPLEHHHPLHGHHNPVFHVHRCREIAVTVNYNAETFHHKFAPSATIAAVTRWSVKKAHLGEAEAAEHVLQICGTNVQPPANAHLGTLVSKGCDIAFDLVRKQLVQG